LNIINKSFYIYLMDTFKIINFSYNRKTNITSLICTICEKKYKLSFLSNPLIEADFLEAHEKPIDEFIIILNKIITSQDLDFTTGNILKKFYYDISKKDLFLQAV